MEMDYHPEPSVGLILLPSLRPFFILAKPVSKDLYHTDGTCFGTDLNFSITKVKNEVWNCKLGTHPTSYRRWATRVFNHGVWTKAKAGKEDEVRLWYRLARSRNGFTRLNNASERVDILYVCDISHSIAYNIL